MPPYSTRFLTPLNLISRTAWCQAFFFSPACHFARFFETSLRQSAESAGMQKQTAADHSDQRRFLKNLFYA